MAPAEILNPPAAVVFDHLDLDLFMCHSASDFEVNVKVGKIGSRQFSPFVLVPHVLVEAFQAMHEKGHVEEGTSITAGAESFSEWLQQTWIVSQSHGTVD